MRKFRVRQESERHFWPEYTNGWWDFWHYVPEGPHYRGSYPEMSLTSSLKEALERIEEFKAGKVCVPIPYPIIHEAK